MTDHSSQKVELIPSARTHVNPFRSNAQEAKNSTANFWTACCKSGESEQYSLFSVPVPSFSTMMIWASGLNERVCQVFFLTL